jgi:hypothetical protein
MQSFESTTEVKQNNLPLSEEKVHAFSVYVSEVWIKFGFRCEMPCSDCLVFIWLSSFELLGECLDSFCTG